MKRILMLLVLTFVLSGASLAQQRVFDWARANAEFVQLDPTDYHSGRVYRPGPNGGNIHVDIEAKQPVTIAMAVAEEWNQATQHPENLLNVKLRCLREHVVSTTYTCELPPDTPMVLLIRDERDADHALVKGIGAVLGQSGARQLISPNDVKIQYYSWVCVQNCIQPEFQWVRLVKEKYQLTTVPKIYSLLTPERDGQQLNIAIKAPVPMTIAVVASQAADQVFDNPQTLHSALLTTACKQRGIQQMNFDCSLHLADGPQSLIIVPEANVPSHKKAEIQVQATKCVANCTIASN